MRTFTAAEAKNRFGEMADHARSAPVVITKFERPVLVVMAFEEFERLHALDCGTGRSSADTGNAGEDK